LKQGLQEGADLGKRWYDFDQEEAQSKCGERGHGELAEGSPEQQAVDGVGRAAAECRFDGFLEREYGELDGEQCGEQPQKRGRIALLNATVKDAGQPGEEKYAESDRSARAKGRLDQSRKVSVGA
jgi:hypothetical protein